MTTAVEDYVKTIYSFGEWDDVPATPSALAARLGLAASSVTEMVKKLAASGLVEHVPYGAITLTQEGRSLAMRMVRRHRLIETWLVESFGYRWDEVHEEADVLEHALSDRMLDAIFEQLGRPVRDPHGDPIPSSDGSVVVPAALLLRQAPDGHEGTIVRIRDRDPLLLRHLQTEGFELDAPLRVLGRKPFGGSLTIELRGVAVDVGDEAAGEIWVSRQRLSGSLPGS